MRKHPGQKYGLAGDPAENGRILQFVRLSEENNLGDNIGGFWVLVQEGQ
jgi:hypothetical protein